MSWRHSKKMTSNHLTCLTSMTRKMINIWNSMTCKQNKRGNNITSANISSSWMTMAKSKTNSDPLRSTSRNKPTSIRPIYKPKTQNSIFILNQTQLVNILAVTKTVINILLTGHNRLTSSNNFRANSWWRTSIILSTRK